MSGALQGNTVSDLRGDLAGVCVRNQPGRLRGRLTDDVVCGFIDTNYEGESFFVRTSADKPYENLRRALRAEIDEAARADLYSALSRLFDPLATGKIAATVINHYGDEVQKVYEVGGT